MRGLLAAGWWPRDLIGSNLELVLTGSMMLIAVAYLWPALRRVYGVGHGRAGLTGTVLALLFFPMIFVYRYLLFWITWLVARPQIPS